MIQMSDMPICSSHTKDPSNTEVVCVHCATARRMVRCMTAALRRPTPPRPPEREPEPFDLKAAAKAAKEETREKMTLLKTQWKETWNQLAPLPAWSRRAWFELLRADGCLQKWLAEWDRNRGVNHCYGEGGVGCWPQLDGEYEDSDGTGSWGRTIRELEDAR